MHWEINLELDMVRLMVDEDIALSMSIDTFRAFYIMTSNTHEALLETSDVSQLFSEVRQTIEEYESRPQDDSSSATC